MIHRITVLVLLFATTSAMGVSTSHWTHTSEAEFKTGSFDQTVATNFGDVKLSRAIQLLLGQNDKISEVYSLAEAPDGSIFAGTGPQGVLLRVKDGKVSTIATLGDGVAIYSLLFNRDGKLLIGASGENGKIYRLDNPDAKDAKPVEIFHAEGVQYVWGMVQNADGTLYAATGPNGQLFAIKADGSHSVLFDSDENNLVCLISDGKDKLYAGTDPNGLVYRIDRKTGDAFVMYDAAEAEISSLVLDEKGNLYASTAEANDEATPQQEESGNGEQMGRPEVDKGLPIPFEPPKVPEPPPLPLPGPGEPNPIPKQQTMAPLKRHIYFLLQEKPKIPRTAATEQAVPTPASSPDVAQPSASGNAVYKIDLDGFVTEVFRAPIMIFGMVEHNGTLLLATGSEGSVYELNPAAEETSVIAKSEPKQVMSILSAKDGSVYLGMANTGEIARMSPGFASKGTYTSAVLDATQVSRFGKIRLHGKLPSGTTLSVSTRSGNVQETTDAGWSPWSPEVSASEFLPIASPSARFFQYRLTFTSNNGKSTSVVDEVSVAYQTPNLAPQVKSIKIAEAAKTAAGEQPVTSRTITWDATDPNEDALRYTLWFRSTSSETWTKLKDDLTDATFDWDTRTVADGRYELRVAASDERANPPGLGKTGSRISDPITVDNTPPVIGDLKSTVTGKDVHLTLTAVDRRGTVALLEYAVDSNDVWQSVLPSDNIADSPEEAYDFTIANLAPGDHQISLRCTDDQGNHSFENVVAKVSEK